MNYLWLIVSLVIYISPHWIDAKYDETMYALAQKWSEEVTKFTEATGTDDPFLYLNFAAQFQDPICAYGKDNVAFMHEVAAQYDPTGVFQTLVPGGFKLSKACGGGCKRK